MYCLERTCMERQYIFSSKPPRGSSISWGGTSSQTNVAVPRKENVPTIAVVLYEISAEGILSTSIRLRVSRAVHILPAGERGTVTLSAKKNFNKEALRP